MKITFLHKLFLLALLCIFNYSSIGCTFFCENTVMGTTIDKTCTAPCTNCAHECCCHGNCNSTSNSCAQQSSTKYTITASGDTNLWAVHIGLSGGWESETVTTGTCTANCTTCGTAELLGWFQQNN